ncbi:MAG: PilN domain-containing protein [Thermoanaerobaculia bacterium]
MIKINLLAEGKRPVVARKAKSALGGGGGGGGAREVGNLLLVTGVVAGLLAGGAWFFLVQSKLSQKEKEVQTAEKEVEELKQVIKEVDDYKIKKTELERKIDVINGLKANQRGPVQIMDQVSRSLPELLWLGNMEVNPSSISLRGSAFNMSAVANFIDNLDKVEEFAEPILNDATQKLVRGRAELYDFKINLGYSFKKTKAPTLTTESGAAAASADGSANAPAGAVAAATNAKAAADQRQRAE